MAYSMWLLCFWFGMAVIVLYGSYIVGLFIHIAGKIDELFRVSKTFGAETLAGFKVQYRLDLICKRIDKEDFENSRMYQIDSRDQLAEDYNNEFFRGFFAEHLYFFHLGWRLGAPVADAVRNGSLSAL